MHLKIFLVGLCGLCLMLVSAPGVAAEPDLRIVERAAAQDGEAVRALLEDGVDANTARADGVTALLWAAHWDDLETADALLRAGADVNAADDHGVTALARACENASETLVTRLLAAGANPNGAQSNGLTPLMTAARTGNVAVVRALLSQGATVNATTTRTHETALMWAIAERHLDIVRALIDGGASVHPTEQQAFSPLMRAAGNGDMDAVTVLLDAGARVNDVSADGTHPLVYAILQGRAEIAHLFLEHGADPNANIDGVSALHASAGNVGEWLGAWSRRHNGRGGGRGGGRIALSERLPLVQALLARGADPNARITLSSVMGGFLRNGAYDTFTTGSGDVGGATPLWVTAHSMNGGGGFGGTYPAGIINSTAEVMRTLLAAGADPSVTTNDGSTSLMAAAGCGHWVYFPGMPRADRRPSAEEAVQILVEEAGMGAAINHANEADFIALHCAAFSGLNELVEYLVSNGAELDARDWRGRTPFRIAEGAKQAFQFQEWPEVAELLRNLGADTGLGIPGVIHERAVAQLVGRGAAAGGQ